MSDTSITFTPNAPALTFNGGGSKTWLTISADGVMSVGPGLSEDEATQRVAAILAESYSALHRDQAAEIARLRGREEEYRKALEPFAAAGGYLYLSNENGWSDSDEIELCYDDGIRISAIPLSAFRAAARALATNQKGDQDGKPK